MSRWNTRNLTTGSIPGHLLRLTAPAVVGFLAITAFNITDTYFVSRLGTVPLAAMGFTFPVVMVIGAIASGISMGAGAILGRALGAGDKQGARKAATSGLMLSLALTAVIGVVGLSTMDLLFKAMGAGEETLPLVKDYMRLWYAGCVVVVTPPVGDSNLRASGDMIRPTLVMLTVATANVVLDPVLIFGWGPFPAMGIKGAVIATILSRAVGMVATLTFNIRVGLLSWPKEGLASIVRSWGHILKIGVPTALTQLMPSLLKGILTSLAAVSVGTAGVAAIAAAGRVESVPLLVAHAFNYAVLTLTAQNFGAGKHGRVDRIRRFMVAFSLAYGAALAVTFLFTASGLSKLFTQDTLVLELSSFYLRTIFICSSGLLLLTWTSVLFNAVGLPLKSLAMNAAATGIIMIPGAFIGMKLAQDQPFQGMAVGLTVAYGLSGIAAWLYGKRTLLQELKI